MEHQANVTWNTSVHSFKRHTASFKFLKPVASSSPSNNPKYPNAKQGCFSSLSQSYQLTPGWLYFRSPPLHHLFPAVTTFSQWFLQIVLRIKVPPLHKEHTHVFAFHMTCLETCCTRDLCISLITQAGRGWWPCSVQSTCTDNGVGGSTQNQLNTMHRNMLH